MRAIVLPRYGGPEVMRLMEAPDPEAGPAEIVVNVAYTALNRADMLQRMGKYPPPKPLGRNPSLGGSPSAHFAGEAVAPATPDPEIPGLEFSGVVEKVGARVERWRPGDRVFGLLPGGGYAEKVVTHELMAMPVPQSLSLAEAAGVAETFLTAYDALVNRAGLRSGERALIHAGGSGVGTAAIQLAQALGATVFATAGSPEKVAKLQDLGAFAINYTAEEFVAIITSVDRDTIVRVASRPAREAAREAPAHRDPRAVSGRPRDVPLESDFAAGPGVNDVTDAAIDGGAAAEPGVDVVLDFIGGPWLAQNMAVARTLGRIVVVGLLGGPRSDIDLNLLLRKRLTLIGTALRSRSPLEKMQLTEQFQKHALPLLARGDIRPIIDSEFPLDEAAAAHRYMEANKNFGKIVLRIGGGS